MTKQRIDTILDIKKTYSKNFFSKRDKENFLKIKEKMNSKNNKLFFCFVMDNTKKSEDIVENNIWYSSTINFYLAKKDDKEKENILKAIKDKEKNIEIGNNIYYFYYIKTKPYIYSDLSFYEIDMEKLEKIIDFTEYVIETKLETILKARYWNIVFYIDNKENTNKQINFQDKYFLNFLE